MVLQMLRLLVWCSLVQEGLVCRSKLPPGIEAQSSSTLSGREGTVGRPIPILFYYRGVVQRSWLTPWSPLAHLEIVAPGIWVPRGFPELSGFVWTYNTPDESPGLEGRSFLIRSFSQPGQTARPGRQHLSDARARRGVEPATDPRVVYLALQRPY